jgi:nucleoside recognition membrane protein YjiH
MRRDLTTGESDYSDNKVLDAVRLSAKSEWAKGILRCLVFSAIAVFVFFIPLSINGTSNIVFGFIYKYLKNLAGIWGVWFSCALIVGNASASVYAKVMGSRLGHSSRIREYCSSDTVWHTIFYVMGAVFMILYTLDVSIPAYNAPSWLMHPEIAPVVIGSIVVDCVWILPVGAFFMPFLITYGFLDFVGAFMEPIMRPIFRTPGRSALDAVGSFVSSASVGVMITNSLYRAHVYTKKEAAIIATGFSAVSVGFAYMVIDVAGLSHHFIKVYSVSMLLCFLTTAIVARLYPLNKKPNVYADGKKQTETDLTADKGNSAGNPFKLGCVRAVKQGYVAPPIAGEIVVSLKSVMYVMPKVFSLMTAVCVSAMVLAFYTPVFSWIGVIFRPLLSLLGVREASLIADSFAVGIAEMFLPVLMISDKADVLSEGARFMVAAVSMVQIIFFSDSACVMLALKMPVTFKDLVIIFFERTIVAIILVAPMMHLLF